MRENNVKMLSVLDSFDITEILRQKNAISPKERYKMYKNPEDYSYQLKDPYKFIQNLILD